MLEAKLTGQREEVLEIIIDQQKLESYGLAHADIYTVVSRNNLLIAAGAVDTANGRFSVKVPGLLQARRRSVRLPVKSVNGTVVTLTDVAEIRRTFKDRSRYALYNGSPAITIEVVKRQGENIIETNHEVRALPTNCRRAGRAR